MKKVIIYTSETCGYCKLAKDFLKENGVTYMEKNVNTDPQAQREMKDMNAAGVPLIKVDDEIIRGFDKERLEALFGKMIVECPKCRQKLRFPKNIGTIEATCSACSTRFKFNTGKA